MRRRDPEPLSPEVARDLAVMDAVIAGGPVPPGGEPLAALATALRAGRPTPGPAFAAALDRRITGDGAPVRPQRSPRRSWLAPRSLILAGGALAAGLVVAVNVAGGLHGGPAAPTAGSNAAPDAASAVRGAQTTTAATPTAAPEGSMLPREARTSAPRTLPGRHVPPDYEAQVGAQLEAQLRKVQRNATLRLATTPDRLDDVVSGVLRTVDAVGGYVASSSVERRAGSGSATFDLRVPVDRLPTAMARLSRLGAVQARSEDSLDLTRRVAGATDRTAGLVAERRSLLRQIAAAGTPAELARLRGRLRSVEGRLAAARTEEASLRRRAAYSTIDLDVTARKADGAAGGSGGGSWTPGDALGDAVHVLGIVAGGLLVGLSALLPLILLALAGWGIARVVRRRRRAAALDGPA